MTKIRFSAAQHRALLWLPADGSPSKAPHSVSGAVLSLLHEYPKLVKFALPTTGRHYTYWLTAAGMDERKRQEETP